MDATRQIQIAVARADLAISQARASPWPILAAVLIALAVLLLIKRGNKQ